MSTPWHPGDTPEEQAARREAYERLTGSARRVGLSLERLGQLLRALASNEAETRRFLSSEVYGVPDEHLDDYLRVRMSDLAKDEETREDRPREG